LLGQGCLAWLEVVGTGSKLYFCVAMSLCYKCKMSRRRESPWAFKPGELKHKEGSQVQLVFGVFSPKTAIWEQQQWVACELSNVPPGDVLSHAT